MKEIREISIVGDIATSHLIQGVDCSNSKFRETLEMTL